MENSPTKQNILFHDGPVQTVGHVVSHLNSGEAMACIKRACSEIQVQMVLQRVQYRIATMHLKLSMTYSGIFQAPINIQHNVQRDTDIFNLKYKYFDYPNSKILLELDASNLHGYRKLFTICVYPTKHY